MANTAGTQRQSWKDRIDRSDWVDSTPWLEAGQAEPGADVEFLEAEPSAYRLTSNEGVERAPIASSPWAKVLGFGAIGVVLIALAIMSRPGDDDPFEQLPPDEQQAILQRRAREAGSTETTIATVPAPAAEAAAVGGPAVQALPAIPQFRDDLPEALPGTVFAYGIDGSILRIERSLDAPQEAPLVLSPEAKRSSMAIRFGGDFLVQAGGLLHRASPDGEVVIRPTVGDRLLPAGDERIVTVQGGPARQTLRLVPPGATFDELAEGPVWELGANVQAVGAWGDRLVLTQLDRIWLLDVDGRSTPVTQGRLLAFDGRHLATVQCPEFDGCRITVGTPDEPNRQVIPVEGDFANVSINAWTGSVAISSDGNRLAFIVDRGPVALPVWLDMTTGEVGSLANSANHGSALTWSPDGQWLAYTFLDDVLVWSVEEDKSWRIITDRQLSYLAWTELSE